MTKLVMRHGLSAANDANNPAYGSPAAGLLPPGREQARQAGLRLTDTHSFDTVGEWVATSRMRRTQETAVEAGCLNLVFHGQLDEATQGLPLEELLEIKPLLKRRQAPPSAIASAHQILENPPSESLWVTHGLVIVGLCEVLGVNDPEWRFLPHFGEIRELPI